MNTGEEPEREIEALRVSISRLSVANLRISESPGLETVMHEALEGVHLLRAGSRPLGPGFSSTQGSIFSMTSSRPPWRSTVSCPP